MKLSDFGKARDLVRRRQEIKERIEQIADCRVATTRVWIRLGRAEECLTVGIDDAEWSPILDHLASMMARLLTEVEADLRSLGLVLDDGSASTAGTGS